MAKKRLTINQQQWKKEMERIQRFQRSASKRGFYFPDDILPQQPKRITKKSLEKLANITPEEQYAKAVYLDRDTGKMMSGSEGRKLERSKASKKGWQTRKYKATPRPKPEKPSADDRVDVPSTEQGKAKKGWSGGIEPLEVNSLIRAMDRALEILEYYTDDFDFTLDNFRTLIETWNNTKERFNDHKYVLEEYLKNNDNELQYCLNELKYYNTPEAKQRAYNRLLQLSNYNTPLPTETLKQFEGEYTEIDLTDHNLPFSDE